ncbi:uncharacterized protein B0I36DRAFT_335016 [Microdochium trichocladiopsis]|uniref:Uncharacterized protein n=1 Tax=Microdochium trichocladiopsis TaxID=1682393 RepID=A0A9P8XYA6_9PEZI|nr:uncharacterized protein B0I36DRAFT_335016 [Microdochium trichocladiopsis]KAH7021647.1 hypothetical protein B0I36DRAFT_335016 [Microdochium trichocladiopsis]
MEPPKPDPHMKARSEFFHIVLQDSDQADGTKAVQAGQREASVSLEDLREQGRVFRTVVMPWKPYVVVNDIIVDIIDCPKEHALLLRQIQDAFTQRAREILEESGVKIRSIFEAQFLWLKSGIIKAGANEGLAMFPWVPEAVDQPKVALYMDGSRQELEFLQTPMFIIRGYSIEGLNGDIKFLAVPFKC